jgi:hypothetical protein
MLERRTATGGPDWHRLPTGIWTKRRSTDNLHYSIKGQRNFCDRGANPAPADRSPLILPRYGAARRALAVSVLVSFADVRRRPQTTVAFVSSWSRTVLYPRGRRLSDLESV